MKRTPQLDRHRLAQIAGMLGSKYDGERANAALMVDRMVREAGMTWQQIFTPGSMALAQAFDQTVANGLRAQLTQVRMRFTQLSHQFTQLSHQFTQAQAENQQLRERIKQLETAKPAKPVLREAERTRIFDILVAKLEKLTKDEAKFVERSFFNTKIGSRDLAKLQRLVGRVMTQVN